MLTPNQVRTLIERYVQMMCDTDVDGIIELFAEEATAEDPVGGNVQEGITAIRAFYSGAAPALQVKLVGPVCVAGSSCAFPLLAELSMGDSVSYLDATDVFTFNDEGKITSMRAYWNFEDVRSEP
jgi:steroid delta-isomerase